MVSRLAPTIVVDLDGTLLTCNSLHLYIRLGLKYLLRKGRTRQAMAVAALMAKRRLRLISHVEMKRGCVKAIGWEAEFAYEFCQALDSKVNALLLEKLQQWEKAGGKVLIASAAYSYYIHFSEIRWPIVATVSLDAPELRGERKLKAVQAWLEANDAEMAIAISDHWDDEPLLKAAPRAILVNPSETTLRHLRHIHPEVYHSATKFPSPSAR